MMHGLLIPSHAQKIWIPMDEIVVLRSVRNYTKVILRNNKTFLLSRTLKVVAGRIAAGEQFFRVSRGCLLNLKQVAHYEQSELLMVVHLSNGETETVSRRRQLDFFRALEKVNYE